MIALSEISDAIVNRLCCFLVHRYLSDFLKTKIDLEYFSCSLSEGSGSVENVYIDTELINKFLESSNVPLIVIDGFIHRIDAQIPIKNLLHDSCEITIRGLQVTLRPRHPYLETDDDDLVTSMIGSMVESMATSIQIAEDFVKEKDNDSGADRFAEVVDILISQFRITFSNTIVRIETEPEETSGLCTAIEIHVDRLEIIDRQMEQMRKNEIYEDKNLKGSHSTTVVEQPQPTRSTIDLNKVIHISGVRLYTDVFSNIGENFQSESPLFSQNTESASLKEDEKPAAVRMSDNVLHNSKVDEVLVGSCYKSCYSVAEASAFENSVLSTNVKPDFPARLESFPIQFAEFTSDLCVYVHIHESDQAAKLSKQEIRFELGGLFVFATPSQIQLLKDLLSKMKNINPSADNGFDYCGKPITPKERDEMRNEFLCKKDNQGYLLENYFGLSNVRKKHKTGRVVDEMNDVCLTYDPRVYRNSANENLIHMNRNDRQEVDNLESIDCMASVSLSEDYETHTFEFGNKRNVAHHGHTTTVGNGLVKKTLISFSTRAFLVVIPHKDYLGESEMQQRMVNGSTPSEVIKTLGKKVETFFEKSREFPVDLDLSFEQYRQLFGDLFSEDHLRLCGTGLYVKYLLTKSSDDLLLEAGFSSEKLEFIEYLSPSSNGESRDSLNIGLISFPVLDDVDMSEESTKDFVLLLKHSRMEKECNIEINLARCSSEIDMSLVDRISSLLVIEPFYASSIYTLATKDVRPELYTSIYNNVNPIIFNFSVKCPSWEITLRFPKVVLLPQDRKHYEVRNLEDESLSLTFQNVLLEVSEFDVSQFLQCGTVSLSASALHGAFFGDTKVLECNEEEMKFLYAGSLDNSNSRFVSVVLSYDFRDSSLRLGDLMSGMEHQRAQENSIQSDNEIEGPFSVDLNLYDAEKVIRVGTREELNQFGSSSFKNSRFCLKIFAGQLRIYLPSHQFYEVLYNRLANDLFLWESGSPLLRKSWFLRGQPEGYDTNDDDEGPSLESIPRGYDDTETEMKKLDLRKRYDRKKKHEFSLIFDAAESKLFVCTNKTNEETISAFNQVCLDIMNLQMFALIGYHSVEGVNYFYFTSAGVHLFHQEGDERCDLSFDSPPRSNYEKHDRKKIFIEPDEQISRSELIESMTIGIRVEYAAKNKEKDMLVALSLNNGLFDISSFSDLENLWITQLFQFFKVEDYAVNNYCLPEVNVQVHVHLSSTSLDYFYTEPNLDSRMHLRFTIGSCDISYDIVPNMDKYKFGCILEDSKLLLSIFEVDVQQSDSNNGNKRQKNLGFVQLLSVDNFQLEALAGEALFDTNVDSKEPLIDIKCKHGLIKLYVCADSLACLINLVMRLTGAGPEGQSLTVDKDPLPLDGTGNQIKFLVSDTMSTSLIPELTEELSINSVSGGDFQCKGLEDSILVEKRALDSSDEEFCMIEEIPGSGVTNRDGNPRIHFFDDEASCSFQVDMEYIAIPKAKSTAVFPPSYPHKTMTKYSVQDFSVELHFYGGNDFGNWQGQHKLYSSEEYRNGKGRGQKISSDEIGGTYRDHSVQVCLEMTKANFEYGLFDDGPILCYHCFTVKNIEIRDKLASSMIDRMMYQYSSTDVPKRECTPMLAIRLMQNRKCEGKLRISVLPIRLNLDLDTIEFLKDFFSSFSSLLLVSEQKMSSSSVPVIEPSQECSKSLCFGKNQSNLNDELSSEKSEKFSRSKSEFPSEPMDSEHLLGAVVESDEKEILFSSSEDAKLDSNLQDLFNEKDLKLLVDSDDVGGSFFPSKKFSDSRFCYQPPEETAEGEASVGKNEAEKEENGKDFNQTDNILMDTSDRDCCPMENCHKQRTGVELFFKEFTFSPSVLIRLDFHSHRVIMDKGAFIGLLSALSNLQCAEIVLSSLHNVDGMLGIRRCINYAVQEWTNDIVTNQVSQIIGSYAPITPFVQIAKGMRDLLLMPVDEYRKADGHVVRGLQKGAQSFGFSAASVTVDIAQKTAGMIEKLAEIVFDIVSPSVPSSNKNATAYRQVAQKRPNDLKQGFHMAYETVKEGVTDTAVEFHRVVEEGGVFKYCLQQSPRTVVHQVVVGAKATKHVLDGLKCHLSPDVYKEELDKWKSDELSRNSDNRL